MKGYGDSDGNGEGRIWRWRWRWKQEKDSKDEQILINAPVGAQTHGTFKKKAIALSHPQTTR
ncbi:hypothetical protein BOTCAL_0587g00020 [Botryotinia calthae]|uniref:Uncharacterized protein n=1 Tax=Botryotinia calthae TaxID=38488 RepID=A0A4Y8CLU2_9HELO|nr:hypothetical protein BOTCAL_0587g00020 [Botryotinia calthae]